MIFWIVFILCIFFLIAPYRIGPNTTRPKEFEYIGVVLIILVSLFRFDVGYDYPAYYSTLWPTLDVVKIERYEPLSLQFFYLTDALKWPPLIFILFGLVTYGFIFYSLRRYTPNFFLATLTFIAFFFFFTLGVIRQGTAIAIVLYGYRYIVKKNFIKYIICVMVASCFHSTAIIAFLIPIIYNYFNFKILIITSIILITGYTALEYLISTYFPIYNIYLKKLDSMEGGNTLKYFYIMLNAILFFLSRKHKKDIYPLLFISSIGALFPFILGGHLGGRVANYFLIFLCISIPKIFNYYSYKIRIGVGGVLCSFFIALLYVSTGNEVKSPYTPYQTIFTIDYKNPKFKRY